jgi:hypothetical protein
VSEETARVSLGDDCYQGAVFSTADGMPKDYEVPKSQLERWEAAKAAYEAMQGEIEQVMREQREQALEASRARPRSQVGIALEKAYSTRISEMLRTPPMFRAKEPE